MVRKPTAKSKASTTADNTAAKHPASHLAEFKFQPGVSPNPKGRPKGSRNKLGEEFLSKMLADFELHGTKVIETVRTEEPAQYLKVVASILPKELNVTTNAVEEMSDDDLARAIAALESIIAQPATARSEAASGHQPAKALRTLQ